MPAEFMPTVDGCDDCSVEPGEMHRWPGCPGAVRARARLAQNPPAAAQEPAQETPAAPGPGTDTPEVSSAAAGLIPARMAYQPPLGTWARWGRKKPKNIYLEGPGLPSGGLDIGRMDLPEYGALVVRALNQYLSRRDGDAP